MKYNPVLASLMALTLAACGGGGTYTIDIKQDGTPVGSGTLTVPSTSNPAPSPAPSPAPTPAPAPVPVPSIVAPTDITLGNWPNTLLQTGLNTNAYWFEDGVWGPGGLTRGTYTGLTGTQYEQKTGVSPTMGPNGEVAAQFSWAWPTGTTEVKSYMSFENGAKPGWSNSWIVPGGFDVRLLDGTNSQTYPSGATPGSVFPLQLPLTSLKSSFAYKHNTPPTGRGQLTYDIWLQNTPTQCHGFDNCQEITHEIMIPLDYWGGYGAYPNRNPSWYSHDATIDGYLWHIYFDRNFGAGWTFVVFEPDHPGIAPGTLHLDAFINYLTTQKDTAGVQWAKGNEYVVSAELGVEAVDGTGNMTLFNYRVWK